MKQVLLSMRRLEQLVAMSVVGAMTGSCAGPEVDGDGAGDLEVPDQAAIAEGRSGGTISQSQSGDANFTPAIISNGTVQLGVNPEGQLNVVGESVSSGLYGTNIVGLRYVPTNGEATAPGCMCEGWGAADGGTGVTGYADEDAGGIYNLSVESFSATASEATSVVNIGGTLRVTHAYRPSAVTPYLYDVAITLENISGSSLSDVRYSRVMDWDIGPNTFSEYVSMRYTGTTGDLLYSDDNGFEVPDPLGTRFSFGYAGMDFEDVGPWDHGAIFDFGFGGLDAGATRTFTLFYGSAGTEADALEALGLVGAEVYSLAQGDWDGTGDPISAAGAPSGTYGATTGEPHTFIFAFAGVGGIPMYLPGSLGGYAWNDLDADGVWEDGESGLEGVEVSVIAVGSGGSCDDADATVLSTSTTGLDGSYAFTELPPGGYCLQFDAPEGYQFSTAGQSSDAGLDSDPDPVTGRTPVIELSSGESDFDRDAGLSLIPQLVCGLEVNVFCEVPASVQDAFVCSDAKPLDVLTMIWGGDQVVDLRAWKGSVGSTLLAEIIGVEPGQKVSVSGYDGASNDVYWEMFASGTGFSSGSRLGQSTFHLSCSDSDMDGSDDCGKLEGDGKGKTGYVNTWLLEGLAGSNGLSFSCTPEPSEAVSSCSAQPGSTVTFVYELANLGDALTGASLTDATYGEIAGSFDLGVGETRTYELEVTLYDTTTVTGMVSGLLDDGGACGGTGEATVEAVYDGCAACKGGTKELALQYLGSQSGEVAVYEGPDAKSDKLLYRGPLGPEPFRFYGLRSDGTIGKEASIWIDGVQQAKAKVDCSDVVGPGLRIGAFKVLYGYSKDSGLMCPLDTCHPSPDAVLELSGKEVRWNVTNLGELGLEISRITASWPASNGDLIELKRDGDVIHKGDFPAPSATIDSGWEGDVSKRTIGAGNTDTLKLKFPNDVSLVEPHSISVEFSYGCAIDIEYLPSTTNTGSFSCSKPIDQLSMIWNGSEDAVWVTAWKGSVGSTMLASLAPVSIGETLTVSGFAGSPNDVYWEIFSDAAGTTKLGESTFHLSCSDSAMDGPEDCGQPEGDGKGGSGYLNNWLLAGMVDNDETLVCP